MVFRNNKNNKWSKKIIYLWYLISSYKKKQEDFKKLYGKRYHYYHLEEVKNKYGKTIEYRIVETVRKSKLLENLDLIFRKENGVYSGVIEVSDDKNVINSEYKLDEEKIARKLMDKWISEKKIYLNKEY